MEDKLCNEGNHHIATSVWKHTLLNGRHVTEISVQTNAFAEKQTRDRNNVRSPHLDKMKPHVYYCEVGVGGWPFERALLGTSRYGREAQNALVEKKRGRPPSASGPP